jgi:hypothetical protein
VAHAAALQVTLKALGAKRRVELGRAGAALFDERAHFLGDFVVDRLHQLAVGAGAEQRPDRRVVVGAEQDDFGELGAERLERAR